jgi:monoamine oxidase
VVITVPLGVLKNGGIQFTPALPEEKLSAINALEMGTLNKVYLEFDRVFWNERGDDRVNHITYMDQQKGYWADWLNLYPMTNKPILMAFNAATYGVEVESYSDSEIIAQAMAVLRKLYGNEIPTPINQAITRWHRDPFSYGSYSYLTTAGTAETRGHLAADIDDKLFFAGEATHSQYAASVHGAYLSGQREAKKIVDLYR